MKVLAVFIGLAAFVATNAIPMDTITGDSMIPIDPALEKQLSSARFQFKYGEAASTEIPAAQRFDPISARLVALLEELRGSFETGTETLPPLDPFRLDAVGPISIRQIGIITGTFNAQDIIVRGLKNFIIEHMSFSFVGLKLTFDVRVSIINFIAQYQLNSHVAIFFPYNPSGAARVTVLNARVSGFASLGQRSDGFLELSSFELNLDFSTILANIDGVIGDGFVNATFNLLMNLLGPGFLQGQTERISELVTDLLRDTVNEFIGQYRLIDLLG